MITEKWLQERLDERGLTIEGEVAQEVTARITIDNSWDDSLATVVDRLSKYVEEKSARLELEPYDNYGDIGVDIVVTFSRPETDNEIGKRLNQVAGREEQARKLYRELKERFEEKGVTTPIRRS